MTELPVELAELALVEKDTDFTSGLLKRIEPSILEALNYEMISQPRGGPMSRDSFVASVKLEVGGNEQLAKAARAAPASFAKAILLAARCKLLVGSHEGLFYLIPRWNSRLRCKEITPLIGYKGLCEMAQRHPRVHKVEAFLVYEGEPFSFFPGEGKLHHEYRLDVDRSDDKIIASYARIVITEPESTHPVLNDPVVWVMSRKEIDAIMHRSEAWKNAEEKGWKNSPWHTDFAMMARKSPLRAILTKGAVPRDMGTGGALSEETDSDVQEAKKPSLPRMTTQQAIRQQLRIDDDPQPFDFAEEAIDAIRAAETAEQLDALKPRWQHFEGSDAESIGHAYEDRITEIGE